MATVCGLLFSVCGCAEAHSIAPIRSISFRYASRLELDPLAAAPCPARRGAIGRLRRCLVLVAGDDARPKRHGRVAGSLPVDCSPVGGRARGAADVRLVDGERHVQPERAAGVAREERPACRHARDPGLQPVRLGLRPVR